MKLKLTLLALSGLLVFAGCKKDKDDDATPNNPPQNTNTKELLVGKNWKLTGAKAFLGDSIDVYNTSPYKEQIECAKDDIITFNEDNTYTLNDGGSSCSTAILPESGIWELSADQKTLTTDKGTAKEKVLTFIYVTSSTMKANTNIDVNMGVPISVPVTGTFTAQ